MSSQQLTPFDCTMCKGNGYLLEDKVRKVCPKCGGCGTINKIIGVGIYTKNTDAYVTAKTVEEKREALEDKMDELEEEKDDKESEIEGLEEEIDCLESQISELRRKIGLIH
jgi:RecJ-like exonuclease